MDRGGTAAPRDGRVLAEGGGSSGWPCPSTSKRSQVLATWAASQGMRRGHTPARENFLYDWGAEEITLVACSVRDAFPVPLSLSLYWAAGPLVDGQ